MNTAPFVVRTLEGKFRSEHHTMDQARAAAEQANKQAEALKIETRYEAGLR